MSSSRSEYCKNEECRPPPKPMCQLSGWGVVRSCACVVAAKKMLAASRIFDFMKYSTFRL